MIPIIMQQVRCCLPSNLNQLNTSRNLRAVIALLAGASAIALAPICVRLSETGPVASAFWRVALSTPLLMLLAALTTRSHRGAIVGMPPLRNAAMVGFFFAADLAFWHWSIRMTSVANATLLANFAVLFVTLFTWVTGRERITGTFLFGLMLAMGGATAMMGTSLRIDLQHIHGDMLAIVTAIFYAAYILGTKSLREARYPAVMVMAWVTLFAAIFLLPVALLSGEVMLPSTPRGWAVLLALAVFSHTAGQTLIAYALAHLPATFSSVALLLQPVLATLIAWQLFNEHLSVLALVGAVSVLIGITIAGRGSHSYQKESKVLINPKQN
ncbi:MAG: DMT family transporter [Gammaproteobacteria bacterium]